jgi:hypothetical protein
MVGDSKSRMAEVLRFPNRSPRTRYRREDWTDGQPRRLLPCRDIYTTVAGCARPYKAGGDAERTARCPNTARRSADA